MKENFAKLLYVLGKDTRNFVLILLIFVLVSFLEAIGIGLIGPFISIAANPSLVDQSIFLNYWYLESSLTKQQFIALIGLGVATTFVIKSILYFFSQLSIYKFSFGLQRKIELRLFGSYLFAPYTFYLGINTASIIKNICQETHMFTHNFFIPLLQGFTNLIVVVVLTVLLARTDLLLLSIVLGGVLPVIFLFLVFRKRIKRWGEEGSKALQGVIRTVNHGLGGFKETRVIGCEAYFMEQMTQQVDRLEASQIPFHAANKIPRILLEVFLIIPLVAFVSIAQFSAENSQQLISTLSVFAIASIRLMPSASQFLTTLSQVQGNIHSLQILHHDLKNLEQSESLKHYTDTVEKISTQTFPQNKSSVEAFPVNHLNFTSRIELRNISYCYPNTSEFALSDICLKIRKGESIALIGKSGAGKTTLVDVILGLLQPDFGEICVDGRSIHHNIRSWQNLVGYIPQSIFLIDDTIASNIAFGVPEHLIDQAKLKQVIALAQLTELVEQLPNGIQTIVGERGIRLSGGQRQRIGIARVLYHEREVLILDEATSALDDETESLISEAIQALSGIKTLIIIAHRLSTVENCDTVYLLDKGRIIKSGRYLDVVAAKEISKA